MLCSGTIATDEVPQPAEVEGATSTSEKLIEQLRNTCTTTATEMIMLAAKDPKIAAGKAASCDDLTEAEKGKLLSLVSKCVAMIAALQHMGQYIASEQRQSLVMQGQRQAVLDALGLMLAEMQQVSQSCPVHGVCSCVCVCVCVCWLVASVLLCLLMLALRMMAVDAQGQRNALCGTQQCHADLPRNLWLS